MEARRSLRGWAVLLLVLSLLVGGAAGGIAGALTARLASDDEALLAFAMDWLKFSLYGIKTMKLK